MSEVAKSQSRPPESELHNFDGVSVYTRRDPSGRPKSLDAIDRDEARIRAVADFLQRRGYGVMRERHPRAGKVFYLMKAEWAGAGEPPEDPFTGT